MRNEIKSILEENYPTGLDIQKATEELFELFRKHFKAAQIKQGWQEWSRKQINGVKY